MGKPSVIFINRVFPPDKAATAQILEDLTLGLRELGWQVTVITSKTQPESLSREEHKGINVERVIGIPYTRQAHWKRLLSYLCFYPATMWRLLLLPRADVVVTLTDPPLLLVPLFFVNLLKGSRLVHWVQDVYPEIAQSLGVLRNDGWLARLLRGLSSWSLQRQAQVVCIGRCMAERILARGIAPEKISIIPNWANAKQVRPLAAHINPFRAEHGLTSDPLIMYSGNLGLSHPFDTILEAAKILEQQFPQARLVFVGDGPRLPDVQARVQTERISNVQFFPLQPREKLSESLSAPDLHLACMEAELWGLVVPSKVYGVLAAGRPCLFLGPENSEVAQLIREKECGEVMSPQVEGQYLAARMLDWLQDVPRREQAGSNARKAAALWSAREAALEFNRLLRQVAALDTPVFAEEIFRSPDSESTI